MARTGVEAKPTWRSVPANVRRSVDDALGARVVRAMRVWGGYSPTPTFRLALDDGDRAFFKAISGTSNEFAARALAREERAYRELGAWIDPWSPRFLGALRCDDWHVLLLEDAGPKSVPPWTPPLARSIVRAFANFHASTLGRDLPAWLARPAQVLPRVSWSRVAEASDDLREVAALAGERRAEAEAWLNAVLPTLSRLTEGAAALPGPYALLHGDTRSDNLRFSGHRLVLFDWPFAEVGRHEFDLAALAESITVEGGPSPEQVVAWYAERLPVDADALDSAIAWLGAFFADLAWRDDIPGLPRLRPFQRRQLAVVLAWSARRRALPPPTWVASMPV